MTESPPEPALQPIDLLLGEGSESDRAALRARIAADPVQALELADVVHLLDRCRQVRVEPSARLAARMLAVQRLAERRLVVRQRSLGLLRSALRLAAAAGITFAIAWAVDQVRRGVVPAPGAAADRIAGVSPAAATLDPRAASRNAAGRSAAEPVASEPAQLAEVRVEVETPWSRVRTQIEPNSRLWAALEEAQQPGADPLASWLHPRNTAAVLRLDFELRRSTERRLRALSETGALACVDQRVQQIADAIADELATAADPATPALALALRALLAAGGQRQDAVDAAADQLVARLPALAGGELATALAALGEVVAMTGAHRDVVARAGERLLLETVQIDGDNWRRRRPPLLSPSTPVAWLADAGRFLFLAPALGIDPLDAGIVRCLIRAHLEERLDAQQQGLSSGGPEVPIALVYGFSDLLSDAQRTAVERQLRRWRPGSLLPDLVALHQLAWSRVPSQPGFARFQLEVRQFAGVPTPAGLGERGALCLLLATSFAAPGVAQLSAAD